MIRKALVAATLLALGGCGGSASNKVNNCAAGDYVDQSAANAARTVTFSFPKYTPPCISIAKGQSVTFSGDFSAHPLRSGVAPNLGSDPGPQPTPILGTSTGTAASFTFTAAGQYPYYCINHQGQGMYGTVQVK